MTDTTAVPASTPDFTNLTKDPDVITTKDGVDAYGLYVELVRFNEYSGSFDAHIRVFLFENSLSMYTRQAGRKAGRWQVVYYNSHEVARQAMLDTVSTLNHIGRVVEMRGEPLLIQASVSDIVATRKKDKRGADCRWRGINTMDARLGKVTDDLKMGGK